MRVIYLIHNDSLQLELEQLQSEVEKLQSEKSLSSETTETEFKKEESSSSNSDSTTTPSSNQGNTNGTTSSSSFNQDNVGDILNSMFGEGGSPNGMGNGNGLKW